MPACDLTHRFPNVLIRASAGTGKTFQLANRYIALAHAGERPDHILAATFARKAAGEILERVLVRLARAAGDDGELADLARHVAAQFDARPLDREACLALLRKLIHNLHRLRIGTLDSFFVQIAGSFALEMGLPPGWRIVDETTDRQLRAQAIQEVLAGDSAAATVALMHLLSKGDVTSSVSAQIRQVADGLYDLFRETPPEAWQAVPRHRQLEEDEFEEALRTLADFDLSKQKRMATARDGDVKTAREQDWLKFIGTGLAGKLVAGEETYFKVEIPPPLRESYRPLIEHARAVLVGRVADQTDATFRLLQKFDAAYRRLKVEHRALRFDDVTRLLAAAMTGERIDDLALRLDAHVCQLLLDEFQDTSLAQWTVLQPMARVTSAEDTRSFFCVGDVKQAIYGWRGGRSELLEALSEQLEQVQVRPLNCSYRSSSVVIDAANRVFGRLRDNPVIAEFSEVAEAWRRRFEEHTTARDHAGYTCVRSAPLAGDGEDQKVATLKFAAAEAARLHQAHPGCSVGILVRTNKSVGRLIYELRHNHQIIASEEGGNTLTDSAAVALVLSLLTIADHPGHTIARYHVARSPLGPLVGLERWDDEPAARALSLAIRESLLRDGYGRTIYGWVRMLTAVCDQRELGRLLQLVELAYGYEREATGRAVDFVNYVTTQKVEDPTAADVRVMTVHQAKGLQFDIVLLPELDVPLVGQAPPVVVGRPSPTEPIAIVCRYAAKEIQALLPKRFREMFEDYRLQQVNESLCLLYVAMTRAVHALHLIVAPAGGRERRQTFAAVLRAAFCPDATCAPETLLWEHGRADWSACRPRPASTPSEPTLDEPLSIELAPPPPVRRRGLDRLSPSRLGTGAPVDLGSRLLRESTEGLTRGLLLHRWFEQIEWLDDGEPDDAGLLRAVDGVETDDLDPAELLPHFRQLLRTPAIRAVLSRGAYADPSALDLPTEAAGATVEVSREHPFAVREGNSLLAGTIDRLILFRRGGRVVAAEVIDFKSDRLSGNEDQRLETAAAAYRPQLDAYCRAVSRLFGLDAGCVRGRLVFVEAGVVRSLTTE